MVTPVSVSTGVILVQAAKAVGADAGQGSLAAGPRRRLRQGGNPMPASAARVRPRRLARFGIRETIEHRRRWIAGAAPCKGPVQTASSSAVISSLQVEGHVWTPPSSPTADPEPVTSSLELRRLARRAGRNGASGGT